MINKETNVEGLNVSPAIAKPPVSGSCFVVEFKNGNQSFWLADWQGDPGRTLKIENAKKFKNSIGAEKALAKAVAENPHRKLDGWIVPYNCH